MTKYSCPRCNYSTDVTQKYIQDLKRKTKCKAIKSNLSLEDEYAKFITKREEDKKKKEATKTYI